MHWALALLLAAGLCVSADAQTPTRKKPTASKSANGAAKTGRRGKSVRRSSKRQRGQQAPQPDRIREIQQALGRDGSYLGEPSGKWDDSTVGAMKRFQTSHGLNPSGKLDARTLNQLGLGSKTAGVAPPMPPVSSSSVTVPPSQNPRRQ